ncbi:hypothetical protein BDQ17DRAFT_1356249 [Cyathus striatus]|nr:hypothetical protein BDQ17DRAFT_1356249 [Cyathus striatus]
MSVVFVFTLYRQALSFFRPRVLSAVRTSLSFLRSVTLALSSPIVFVSSPSIFTKLTSYLQFNPAKLPTHSASQPSYIPGSLRAGMVGEVDC